MSHISCFSKVTLFTICLSNLGIGIWDISEDPKQAIRAEARVASKKKEWAGMNHLMALASVIGRPIFSVCPNVPLAFRTLLHGSIQPRSAENNQAQEGTITLFTLFRCCNLNKLIRKQQSQPTQGMLKSQISFKDKLGHKSVGAMSYWV